MKLRYKGGNTEKVYVQKKGKPQNVREEVTLDQLTQVFEGMEYHWPKPGSVLSLPPHVGGWLLGKCKPHLEEIPETAGTESAAPRRMVAVMPEEAKPVEPAPAKPAQQPTR